MMIGRTSAVTCGLPMSPNVIVFVARRFITGELQFSLAVMLITGRFPLVPGASPTFVMVVIVAREIASGVMHVMNLDARTTLKRHIHEHVEGENKGEKEQ